jgi:hypothetical protein
MNPRIPKIAHLLRRWCAEQSGRTCEAMFIRFMADVLTNTEAKRFFDAYANEPILRFYSPRMCTITVHQDHFNDDAVDEMAQVINLAETIDPRYKGSKSAPLVKVSLPSRKEVSLNKDLSSFSDEELYTELQRRDEARKAAEELARKKTLVTEFMEAYGLTEADILQVFDVC